MWGLLFPTFSTVPDVATLEPSSLNPVIFQPLGRYERGSCAEKTGIKDRRENRSYLQIDTSSVCFLPYYSG